MSEYCLSQFNIYTVMCLIPHPTGWDKWLQSRSLVGSYTPRLPLSPEYTEDWVDNNEVPISLSAEETQVQSASNGTLE